MRAEEAKAKHYLHFFDPLKLHVTYGSSVVGMYQRAVDHWSVRWTVLKKQGSSYHLQNILCA
jgi:hypothetical protein